LAWDEHDLSSTATQAIRVAPPEETRATPLVRPAAPSSTGGGAAWPLPKPVLLTAGALLLAVLVGLGWSIAGRRAPAPPIAAPVATPTPLPPPPVESITVEEAPTPQELEPLPAASSPDRPTPRRPPELPLAQRYSSQPQSGAQTPPETTPPTTATEQPTAAPDRGRLITGGPGVESAEAAALAKPIFPERARGTGKEPAIKVAVLVDENGNVIQARVTDGDPSKLGFNEAALDAARRTRFLPATKDGVPGKSWTDLIFTFQDPGAPAPPPAPSPTATESTPSGSEPPFPQNFLQ
jgi:TonB family protein